MYDLDKNIEILKNSKSKLVELEKMNDFFKTLDLSSVLINTSLIISYFESNIEREDLGKLEPFNLQYTDSLLELLRKVKSNKEREIASVTIKYNRFIYEQKRLVYNSGKVDLNSRKHKEWRWFLPDLFKLFEVVSFDNLALEQLKPERFLTKKDFEIFNQGEYSMYINAVEGYYSPSSRSNHRMYWNKISIKEFFSIKDYFDKCYPK